MDKTLRTKSNMGAFDSFNARNLDPRQVAQTFVPPEQFFELIRRQHTVIIGPRGSGKTTLLKMLQLSALQNWEHPRAQEVRACIDYTSIFVPADVAWGKQIEALGSPHLSEDIRSLFGVSAFSHHLLIAFVDSIMESRKLWNGSSELFPRAVTELSRAHECQFVEMVSSHWYVTPALPSLLALKLALRARLSLIFEIAQLARVVGENETRERSVEAQLFTISALQSLLIGVDAFNDIVDQPTKKWAILFDELEIAPKPIRRLALQCLRSTDHRILFKLSLSPFSREMRELDDSSAAMPAQDYHPILLTYARKNRSWPFSNALLAAMVESNPEDYALPFRVMGASYVADEEDEYNDTQSAVYRPGSPIHSAYVALADRDISFTRFLADRQVQLDTLHLLSETTRASIIRKITPVVLVRETFRKFPVSSTTRNQAGKRSRKNPDLYTGAQALFAIIEGNPRWFISIVSPIVQVYQQRGRKRVSRSLQADAVREATSRFRAYLATLPHESAGFEGGRGLLSLLDRIGRYFHGQVVHGAFEPEPPLSFIVDSHVSAELEASVEQALHTGAIIYVPDPQSSEILGSVRGKRFRLCYMLASFYRLPLRLGKPRSLSHILSDSSQVDLFNATV